MGLKRKLAWVTGANGFLGSHVVRSLGSQGWDVIGMVRGRATCYSESRPSYVQWYEGGVNDDSVSQALSRYGPPALVFHAAGAGTVRQAEADAVGSFADTVQTTAVLCEALRRSASKTTLILASSAAVYGDCGDVPLEETFPVKPTSIYGRHKLMAEEMCLQASEMHGLRTIMIRYFSLYGPGLRKQIVWDIFRRINSGETCIELFGDGDETRDFLFIDDAVSLALQACKRAPEGHSTINGGSGAATTIAELGGAIAAAAGAKVAIKFNGQTREGDPRHLLASPLKAQSFGFTIGTNLPDGLVQVARWIRTLPCV